ncbi:hypothetical protein B9S53_19940 [Arthrospira sp. O9.13F]|nr:hypothetical protein B9S53_19940 [Arthrospira sp. O9.13F]
MIKALIKAIACFQKPGFFKKPGFLNSDDPTMFLGKAIAFESLGESVGEFWGNLGEGRGKRSPLRVWGKAIAIVVRQPRIFG